MITVLSVNAALAEPAWFDTPPVRLDQDLPMRLGAPEVACKAVNAFRTLEVLEPGEHRLIVSLGGKTGEAITRLLSERGVPHEIISRGEENRRTLVLYRRRRGPGYDSWEWKTEAKVSVRDFDGLLHRARSLAGEGETVLVAGTPPTLPGDLTWAPLFDALRECGARVVLDSSQWKRIMDGGFAPWVLKINRAEWGSAARTAAALAKQMKRLARLKGMHAIVVTDGAQGAYAAAPDEAWHVRMEEKPGKTIFPIGAGDAFAAGLCAAYGRGESHEKALRLATVCAFESIHSPTPGVLDPQRMKHWGKRVKIEAL
jgi:fructose-1-phosphate kinase PfkB-like protein